MGGGGGSLGFCATGTHTTECDTVERSGSSSTKLITVPPCCVLVVALPFADFIPYSSMNLIADAEFPPPCMGQQGLFGSGPV